MGFFSSRKTPDGESYVTDDKSVVKVIRSRFYGKYKDRQNDTPYYSSYSTPTQYSPTSKQHSRSPLRRDHEREFTSSTSHYRVPSTNHAHSHNAEASRPTTDAITMTLTQRLNELAVANSEGLLNDDEYRLLRQNLFERFASGTVVPTEKPVVPLGSQRNRSDGRPLASPSSQGQLSSNFHVNHLRSPSIRSKASVASAMSSLFRRSTSRRSLSLSKDSMINDTSSSIFTMNSSTSKPLQQRLPRVLSKRASDASIRTEPSSSHFDTLSISSRRTGGGSEYSGTIEPSTVHHSLSRAATRSNKRLATPPSSFPRGAGSDTKHGLSGNISDSFDDQDLKTASDIRHQIELVEAEGRRLLDAFNGLELSTLTRRQHQPPSRLVVTSPQLDNGHSTSTLVPHRKLSQRRANDSDTMSIRSITSTSPSMRSVHTGERARPLPSLPSSQSVHLRRKPSVSSVSSRGRSVLGTASSVSILSSSIGRLGVGSSSSVNLTRSSNTHLPLATVSEGETRGSADDEDLEMAALEAEMADIRRRRAEVTGRYEARIEYLRAKLKGAELHEKLLRK